MTDNYEYKPKTAQEVLAVHGDVAGAEARDRAADAGVTRPEYVDYEAALENYEGRSDVEPLADRRARENGTGFADAAFRRQVDAVADHGLHTTDSVAGKTPNNLDDKALKAEQDKAVKDEAAKKNEDQK